MEQAIKAYHQITATAEFQEIERLRSRARHNEASALGHARREGLEEGRVKGQKEGRREGRKEGRREGEQAEREKWQGVVADKDALIAELRSRLGEYK